MKQNKNIKLYRSFIAFELPQNIRQLCNTLQKELSIIGVKGKWTPPGNHHITINFLGNKTIEELKAINTQIKTLNFQPDNIKFRVNGTGYFGRPAKILFLDISDIDNKGDETVLTILKTNTLKQNHKLWKPHLTLARFRNIKESKSIIKADLSDKNRIPEIIFSPEKISVFTSSLTPTGAIYKVIQ